MPLLFSYGTLQQKDVQLATFGRLLKRQPDELPGFEPSLVRIEDPTVVASSGRMHHANGGTDILAVHDELPPGLSAADNQIGWRDALAKLAALVETR